MPFDFMDDEPRRSRANREASAKARRAEMRAYVRLAELRGAYTPEQAERMILLIDLTSRITRKQRSAPVAPFPTPAMERAAMAMLAVNMPAHLIEQETGITRNRLSQWLGARP